MQSTKRPSAVRLSATAGIRKRLSTATSTLVAVLLVSSCTSIEIVSDIAPAPELADVDTYAWGEAPIPAEGTPELDAQIRKAVEEEMEELGFQLTPRADAELFVSYSLDVVTNTRTRDPYFAMYAASEYEIGTLTLEIEDAATGETVYRASAQSELRESAVLAGPMTAELKSTGDPREWNAPRKVAAILGPIDKVR